MKKFFRIAGVVLIAACVLSFLYAGLNWYGYGHVLDGSAELYERLRQRAIAFSAIGAVFAAGGTACMILSAGKRPPSPGR